MIEHQISTTLIVYIAFADYGEETVRRFVRSYENACPGRPHHLLVACKGYGATPPDANALGLPPGALVVAVPDGGFDLGTYRHIAERYVAPRYCLLNSRSRLLRVGWLGKLEAGLSLPQVGAVGATASRQSLLTDHLRMHRYATDGPLLRRILRRSPVNALRHWLRFPPFPNPHLRTNALLMNREVMLKLWSRSFVTRLDTARFENGRGNLTQRLRREGLLALVVGREGVFAESEWARSETFWSGDQANLLVADNQTDRYRLADARERRWLASLAWGDEAISTSISAASA